MAPPDGSAVLVDGPWTHREVTANGVRFHVAECGPADGQLVLLLHGFPQFWWCWREQLPALAQAGLRVVAPDLRGYGATDKPPRGYDAYTLSSDVAGLVRALGAHDAVVVGTDWGGILAWTVATLHPRVVRRLAVLASPHPLRMRAALLGRSGRLGAAGEIGYFQLPKLPEARLQRDEGAYVGELLRRWGGPGYPDAEAEARYREAMRIPAAAHCSLEWYRWSVRSLTRPSGHRFLRLLRRGVHVPVLQLHGAVDGFVPPAAAEGSEAWARAGHTMRVLDGVGHFPAEEAPAAVSAALIEHAQAAGTPA